jgi:hypothetical protein
MTELSERIKSLGELKDLRGDEVPSLVERYFFLTHLPFLCCAKARSRKGSWLTLTHEVWVGVRRHTPPRALPQFPPTFPQARRSGSYPSGCGYSTVTTSCNYCQGNATQAAQIQNSSPGGSGGAPASYSNNLLGTDCSCEVSGCTAPATGVRLVS